MASRSTTNKAKVAGIGASSFLDLKAELASKEREISENKAAGKKTTSNGQKPGKVSVPRRLSFGNGHVYAFLFYPTVRNRNPPYGVGLIRASMRERRGISNWKPSNGQRSKPRTRFWNENQGYTNNSTKERTPGYRKSSMGHYSLMCVRRNPSRSPCGSVSLTGITLPVRSEVGG